jgi:hypothetical protein
MAECAFEGCEKPTKSNGLCLLNSDVQRIRALADYVERWAR